MSLLITVEGLDGMGKSTLVKALVEAMEQDKDFGALIYASKEPGSFWAGKSATEIRKMVLETPDFRPLERELLFYVDASLHARFIATTEKAIVVSDRGLWSHLAYLKGYLNTKQMDYEDYQLCSQLIGKVCAAPDCVVYIEGDLTLMKDRLAGKTKDAIESNSEAFYGSVLETYKDLQHQAEWAGKPMITLSSGDNVDTWVTKVISYLKETFDAKCLNEGNRDVCWY